MGKDLLSHRVPKWASGPVQSAFYDSIQSKEADRQLRDFDFDALLAGCILLNAASAAAQENKTAREITVAAAADLSTALKEIGDLYEKKTGVQVKLSFGASGALTQQIQNDAPFDLFFSADMDYPRQLISSGAADGTTLYQYAVGKLVLWIPADSPLDVEHKGMDVLLDPSVKKIAIANPQHAPYGRAAVAALKHAGVYDRIVDRLVMGESVSQAAQFAESGNAQAGFVALAHAVAPGMRGKGKFWQVPADFYPPLRRAQLCCRIRNIKKKRKIFWSSSKRKKPGTCFRNMDSSCVRSAAVSAAVRRACRSPRRGRGALATAGKMPALQGSRDYGNRLASILADTATGDHGIADLVRAWPAYRLLDCLFSVALEVSGRDDRCAAYRASTNGAGLLRSSRARTAQPARPPVDIPHRTHTGIHLQRLGDRFHSLQPAIRRAALCRVIRRSGPQA